MSVTTLRKLLVAHAGRRTVGIPVSAAIETMRPLPVQAVAGLPSFVLGVALIRGEATPVVDLGGLLDGSPAEAPTRFVTVRAGAGQAALAVAGVAGVAEVDEAGFEALSTLFQADSSAVEAVAVLGSALLHVLEVSRLLPDTIWAAMADQEGA